MNRHDAYTAVAATGRVEVIARIDLVDPDGGLVASSDEATADQAGVEVWGATGDAVSISSIGTSSRTSQLSADASIPPPTGPSSILHPDTRAMVRAWAGIIDDTGQPAWWPQATFLVEDVVATSRGGLTVLDLGLVDALAPLRDNLLAGFTLAEGEPIEEAAVRIAAEFGVDLVPAATLWTTPTGGFDPGRSGIDAVTQILEAAGWEIYADVYGVVSMRPIPPTTTDPSSPRWRYGADAGGIPIAEVKRSWARRRPQGYRVEGADMLSGSVDQVVQVWDSDPSSEGYYNGESGVTWPTVKYPLARSTRQLAAAGYGQLRRNGAGPWRRELTVAPNPAMQRGDMIEVGHDGGLHLGRVEALRVPRGAEAQLVTVRGVWDPEYGVGAAVTVPETDPGTACLVSVSDNFERADGPLASTETDPPWTSIVRPWTIESGQAVIRNDDWAYGAALVSTPLCSGDHEAEIDIAHINGNPNVWLGVIVRSTGGYDGYLAIANGAGLINLGAQNAAQKVDRWAAGNWVHPSGTLNGRRLKLRAVGSTITVLVDDVVVREWSDTRRTGTYVGFMGQGGVGSAAPRVNGFTAQGV